MTPLSRSRSTILRAIENILRVLPDTKNVAVVVGNSPIEKYWKEEIGREVKPLANRIAFTWYDDLSFEDILKHAAALPPQSAIFWELMMVDAAGVVHEEGKALTRLHAVANAPIFSYTDAFFGHEIVGGPHVPVLEHGRQVAEVAVRILGGEKAGDIKTPPVGLERRSSTGGKCSAGESAKAVCRREAKSIFAIRPPGNATAGR